MIHSLLSVCLLTMGVGAKASTPIELNRQQTRQYENNNAQTFEHIFNPQEFPNTSYRYVNQGTPQYGIYNWSYEQTNGTTNQYTFTDNMYTNEGKLTFDPTNPNDTFEWQLEKFPNVDILVDNYDRYEVLSITPNETVYNTTLTKKVGTNLITEQNINAKFTIKIECFYTNNGSLDEYKSYTTGDNVDQMIRQKRYALSQIQSYTYDYQERYINFEINEQTPATGIYENIEFNIPLVKETNTVILLFYKIYCTNIDTEGTNSRVYDAKATDTNGKTSVATNAPITKINGNWSTATVNQEVIDLPGLMWEILAMPFAFISTAFNLTLFPGTPYSLNITNLFMALILMAIIVFILKKVIKI